MTDEPRGNSRPRSDRERREEIATELARQGLDLSFTHAHGGHSPGSSHWVAVVHDAVAGTATRYPPGATKLETAEHAWNAIRG
jgi:hypothetical protein